MNRYESEPGIPDGWRGVYNLHPQEPGVMLGTINILGRPHHVLCVRVKGGRSDETGDAGEGDIQSPYFDNQGSLDWYEDMQDLVGQGYLWPVEIPGQPGEWVICVHPFVD